MRIERTGGGLGPFFPKVWRVGDGYALHTGYGVWVAAGMLLLYWVL